MPEASSERDADPFCTEAEADAYADFLAAYPQYASSHLDRMRATEYGRLDAGGHVYLDYTGGGLYAESQVREHLELLCGGVFGNPHSNSPASSASTALDERARAQVFLHFNASPEEYIVIFTPNATGALKLVGESYPFDEDARCMLTFDNHNSVVGIREFARHHGAKLTYIPLTTPELRVDESELFRQLRAGGRGYRLFAYPTQSNFSGVQHPLRWIEEARAHGWDVLLDAAAFVPANELDLSVWHPDFVSLSFYKMFGYPTGIGALIARKEALRKLRRPWFAGGTVWAASIQGDAYRLAEGAEAFEEGTLNYLGLPAVEIGLRHLRRMGLDAIHRRMMALTDWLLRALEVLQHSNGAPVIRLYGPRDCNGRGGTLALNFLYPDGHIVDERIVDLAARDANISLRTGCFCNPGAGEVALNVSKESLVAGFSHTQESFQEFIRELGAESYGAVRISLGAASNFGDVYRFVRFAGSFVDRVRCDEVLPPRTHC